MKKTNLKLRKCPYYFKDVSPGGIESCRREFLIERGCPFTQSFGSHMASHCSGRILALRMKHLRLYRKLYRLQKKYRIYDELLYKTYDRDIFYRMRFGHPSKKIFKFIARAEHIVNKFQKELKSVKKSQRKETKGYKETQEILKQYQEQEKRNASQQ